MIFFFSELGNSTQRAVAAGGGRRAAQKRPKNFFSFSGSALSLGAPRPTRRRPLFMRAISSLESAPESRHICWSAEMPFFLARVATSSPAAPPPQLMAAPKMPMSGLMLLYFLSDSSSFFFSALPSFQARMPKPVVCQPFLPARSELSGAAALHVRHVLERDLAAPDLAGVDREEVRRLALLERLDEAVERAALEAARAAGPEVLVRLRGLLLLLHLLPLLRRQAVRHVGEARHARGAHALRRRRRREGRGRGGEGGQGEGARHRGASELVRRR